MSKKIIFGLIIISGLFVTVSLAVSNVDKKKRDDLCRQAVLFTDALAIIETDYVDEVKPKDLIYGALKGMFASLDPYSQFMNPEEYNELKVETKGKFGGLGVEITIKDGLATIITPIEGTPAWKAGLKPGDRIVKINDMLTRDINLSDTVKLIRGKPQEAVNLTILRESEKKILEFKVVRDVIKIKDIKEAKILEDGIAYIRLVEFRENTARDINSSLVELSKQGMRALILDLRNNPGGLLESAIVVAGRFIPAGKLITYTKGRKKKQDLKFIAQGAHPILNLPLAVLINEGSASGSEIVAGALQDYKRAVILGTKSFGKGLVQTVIPFSDGSGLRLTTSRYFTPLGRQIHGVGVLPDIIVDVGLKKEKTQEMLEEAGLNNPVIIPETGLDYKSDVQIMAAINYLRPKVEDKTSLIK